MIVRPALDTDSLGLSEVLTDLVAAGLRRKYSDAAFARAHYIAHPDRVSCVVAEGTEGRILGFQSLKLARPGNPYGTPAGWGIIGTLVRPSAARQGVGQALFAATVTAARAAGLEKIDAFIGAGNAAGLAFYDAMGFRPDRTAEGAVGKVFDL